MATQRRDPFGIVGTTVDRRYEVKRLVAEGGFGVVYEAEAIQLGMPVALKVLRVEVATASGDARARFLQEAKLLVRLKHAAIVELTDAAHLDDGTPYLVLSWLDGETLDARLQRTGPMPLDEVMALLAPVASAIEHAHAQGVIHRDLKPGNLMVLTEGVKVLDFGVARWSNAQAIKTTTVSSTGLSIGFAAPEQYGKEFGPIDARTDEFALAGIVYSALTARPPFPGETATEVMFATCNEKVRPSVRDERPEIAKAVDDVLQKALSVRPGHRYESIGAFWRALVAASIGAEGEAGDALGPATDKSGPPQASKPAELGPVATLPTATFVDPPRKTPKPAPAPASIAMAPTQPQGTVRQGEAPIAKAKEKPTRERERERERDKESGPVSSPVSSMPASKRSTGGRIVLFVAIGCIVGAGIYLVVPWLFPDGQKGQGKQNKPSTSASTKPSASTSPSPSGSGSGEPHGPCGDIPETEACIVGGKLHRGPPDGCKESDRPHRAACPQQTVTVGTFSLDKREVTAGRYRKCVEEGKCRATEAVGHGDLPARNLPFADAKAFCAWNAGKRLPTDEEWELAAAGPGSTHREYPWSNVSPTAKHAVFTPSGAAALMDPLAVGSMEEGATPDGLLDMGGNVAEWTTTAAPASAPLAEELEGVVGGPAPTTGASDAPGDGAGPVRRWVRGGSYKSSWDALRTWTREAYPETLALPTLGFRCARTIKK